MKNNSYQITDHGIVRCVNGQSFPFAPLARRGFPTNGPRLLACAILWEEFDGQEELVREWLDLFCREVIVPWCDHKKPLTSAVIMEWHDEHRAVGTPHAPLI